MVRGSSRCKPCHVANWSRPKQVHDMPPGESPAQSMSCCLIENPAQSLCLAGCLFSESPPAIQRTNLLAPANDAPSTPENASVMPDCDGGELGGCETEGWPLRADAAGVTSKPEAAAAAAAAAAVARGAAWELVRSSVSWASWRLTASSMGSRSREMSRKGS